MKAGDALHIAETVPPVADEGCPVCHRDMCEEHLSEENPPPREFARIDEGHYRFEVADVGVTLDLDRLRRDSGSLVGELVVRCSLAGVLAYDGILSAGEINLSSVRARQERGKFLAQRARADIDFIGILEEFSARVIAREREGEPAQLLHELPLPMADDGLLVEGFPLLRRSPLVLFGDGGALKSAFSLWLLCKLAKQGLPGLFVDFELDGADHRARQAAMFPGEELPVYYARGDRPLVHDLDRLQRMVREHGIRFLVVDSAAMACFGPPESAEAAAGYFRALRQAAPGVGSVTVAHVTKSDDPSATKRPFGSAFWSNLARSTWHAKRSMPEAEEGAPDSGTVHVLLSNRKHNLGPLAAPKALAVTFEAGRIGFRWGRPTDRPEFAAELPVRVRIKAALGPGVPLTVDELVTEGCGSKDAVRMALQRNKTFRVLDGGRWVLAAREGQ